MTAQNMMCELNCSAKRCKSEVFFSPRSPEGQAVLLTGQAHGGGVHNGHELFDVGGQQAVEQLLVPVLQRHQQDVPDREILDHSVTVQ